jgi:microcystin-dependent protein
VELTEPAEDIMPVPLGNLQASLALTQFIPLSGIFPSHDGDPNIDPQGVPLGSIRTFAGNFAPGGSDAAEGQLLPINQNTALFSLLGTVYGGNGTTQFALPDLDGRTMIGAGQLGFAPRPAIGSSAITLSKELLPSSLGGGSQPFDDYQPSLPVTYLIRTGGFFPSSSGTNPLDFMGQVVPFAGSFVPDGFLQAAGQTLQIADFPNLFQLIGTTYGGDGVTTFSLPDLRGRTIVGEAFQLPVGATEGQAQATLSNANLPAAVGGGGQPLDNHEPSLALKYLISLTGIFPPHDGGSVNPMQQYLGEVVAFAGTFDPGGWVEAAGQLLPINQNQALFSLLGTQYGGDGQINFRLPDLRDHTAIGTGDMANAGNTLGSNDLTVLPANIDFHFVAATGDFNGDGMADLLWKNALTGATAEWLTAPNGGVATLLTTPLAQGWNLIADGDFNGDGTIDLMWQQVSTGATAEWLMAPTGGVGILLSTPPAQGWNLIADGDFNGDGTTDLMWQHASTGATAEWLMAPTGGVGVLLSTPPAQGWNLIADGDFNGDGTTDLMWQHASSGATAEWLMAPTGGVGVLLSTPPAQGWNLIATGDFNGDGIADLMWQHASSGATAEWLMAPTGGAGRLLSTPAAQGWNLLATADFNGDGITDLLWKHASTGATAEWLMAPTGGANLLGTPLAQGWNVIASGDFNGDHVTDLMWQQPSTGATAEWLMAPTGGANLLGTPLAPGWEVVATADFNSDAIIDLMWQNALTGATAEWLMAPGGGVGTIISTPLT